MSCFHAPGGGYCSIAVFRSADPEFQFRNAENHAEPAAAPVRGQVHVLGEGPAVNTPVADVRLGSSGADKRGFGEFSGCPLATTGTPPHGNHEIRQAPFGRTISFVSWTGFNRPNKIASFDFPPLSAERCEQWALLLAPASNICQILRGSARSSVDREQFGRRQPRRAFQF
jgi:hypothetical protein